MLTLKMCIKCRKLNELETEKCSCGGKEFAEVKMWHNGEVEHLPVPA